MNGGWTRIRLGAAFVTMTGSTPSKAEAALFGKYMPLVKPPELRDGPLDSAEDALSEAGARGARTLPVESVLVSCIGNLGKVGINTVPVAFNQQINAVLPNRATALPEFMFYQALSPAFKAQLESLATGTTVRIVNKSKFNEIEIILPPLPEQRRIVTILDEAFEGIATAKANAEKNLQNARELFEASLDAAFTDENADWRRAKLQDICTLYNGRAYNKDELLTEGKYPVLRVGNFFTNKHWYYSDLELDENKYCDKGDLLYAWSASFGPRIWDGGKVIFHYHIWKVVPRVDLVDRDFLKRLLEWDTEKIKAAQGTGTTMMHVGKGSMDARAVPVPPLPTQRQIVARLDALDQEVQQLTKLLRRKFVVLDELEMSLLRQAFSGALTVKSTDKQVAEVA